LFAVTFRRGVAGAEIEVLRRKKFELAVVKMYNSFR
jgi:hypothetical protein